jgi:uncharacterized membrane protein YheB (UPF0754 family)
MGWADLGIYALIPPIMAGVAWLTNWLGVQMLFYPSQFVGMGGYFGWQGIIPRLRVKLIGQLVKMSIRKICTPRELVQAVHASDAIEELSALLSPQIEDWVDDIIDDYGLRMWSVAPYEVRRRVYDKVREQLPQIARSLLRDLESDAESFVDIGEIAVAQVRDRPELLTELFVRCAGDEIRFVVRSGIYFGFPLGVLQALVWYVLPQVWVLPLGGVLVGGFTNWIALQLIAHPAEPRKFGPFMLQGLYLKRQAIVSHEFARVFTGNFLNSRVLVDHLWNGSHGHEFHRLIRRHVRSAFDRNMLAKLVTRMSVSGPDYREAEARAIEAAVAGIERTLDDPRMNHKVSAPIRQLIGDRMAALAPRDFQQLLLPAFEQDQYLVVLVGGALGGLVGFAQLLWLFGA